MLNPPELYMNCFEDQRDNMVLSGNARLSYSWIMGVILVDLVQILAK